MIAIDDMRPELGSYGCDHMHTPNMDALAADSLSFDNAYVAVAWCSPSRTALLTSRRPDTTMTWSVIPQEYWRERGGNFSTLPQYFREHGYLTLGVGKIFHPGKASGDSDSAYSWSEESLPYDGNGKVCPMASSSFKSIDTQEVVHDGRGGRPAMSAAPSNPDTALGVCANATFRHLAERRRAGLDKRPFFFAVGLHKPHIPWTVPQQYFDRYPLDQISLAEHRTPPSDVPSVAMNNILSGYWSNAFSDFRALRDNGTVVNTSVAGQETLRDEYWQRRARQAYWAALSFSDDNVGAIVNAAKEAGFYDNSVIVLWGDHGYQLGENDQWSKVSNFEQAVRIPLLLRAPGQGFAASRGRRTSALWEAVDLLPTLTELAMGQVPPSCPRVLNASRATISCTDGRSAAPLLRRMAVDVVDGDGGNWSRFAFSQVPRGAIVNGEPGDVPGELFMGYSVRVPEWRYTEWVRFDNLTGVPDWGARVGRELYPETTGDLSCAFDHDHANVAEDPDHASVVAELSRMLRTIV